MGRMKKDNRTVPPPLIMSDPRTTEERESQMIALAINLAEQQLRDGTASSQVITHYLKLGTKREELECKKLEKDIDLASAKTESIEVIKRIEEKYENAMQAMRSYQGIETEDDYEDIQ